MTDWLFKYIFFENTNFPALNPHWVLTGKPGRHLIISKSLLWANGYY